jgi:hypothetical protein
VGILLSSVPVMTKVGFAIFESLSQMPLQPEDVAIA